MRVDTIEKIRKKAGGLFRWGTGLAIPAAFALNIKLTPPVPIIQVPLFIIGLLAAAYALVFFIHSAILFANADIKESEEE